MTPDTCSQAEARRLIVLGSTGSIGVNTLNVVEHLVRSSATQINVVGLAAGRASERLIEQARWHKVKHIAIADPTAKNEIQTALPDAVVYAGDDASTHLVESVEATDVASAIVGVAGLPATLAAVKRGMRISLANKETLVAAGGLVKPLLEKHGSLLIPVDSEHSAIFQCLLDHPRKEVKRIVLTASGGPFRTASLDAIENATVEQALNHPTWNMGPKITIDSATMMNKALEIVEAYWLFDLLSDHHDRAAAKDKISVVVHPQSIVHSLVEFADHSVLAQLGPPDMRTPIQYALTYPSRSTGCSEAMDWTALSHLTFEPADLDRFPALRLAYVAIDAIRAGGQTAGAVLNAANEAAVAAFLDRRIRFGRIVELVGEAMATITPTPIHHLADVQTADQAARDYVQSQLTANKNGAIETADERR